MTELIETAPHEFNAQLNFAGGLDGYFALDKAVKSGGGSVEADFSHAETRWTVTLYYQDSNIVHPGDHTPAGTSMRLEELREFRLSVEAVENSHEAGEKGFNAHVRPRWDGMAVEDDYGNEHRLDVPFPEGVNVHVQGSNIEFREYHQLLREASSAVGVSPRYWDNPHRSSSVQQAERYVRVHENRSGPVHARDGPLARLGHLLEHDRDGRREIEQADVAEDGENVPGYRHQTALDEQRVREVLPNHDLPKRVKHYRARQSHNLDKDNPLRHPKVGAIYQSSLWRNPDSNHGVTPAELEQLTEELEEMLLTVLHEAGLDVTHSAPFVSDDYFEATTSDRHRQVVELPLDDIEATQENVVIEHVAGGLSPVEWQSLETLVTDGGAVSPQDIAEDGGFHRESVYRALDSIEELVEREYGSVSLRSTHVGQLVHEAVRKAREGAREAVEAGAKAIEASERGLDEGTSALVAWASKHLDGQLRERESAVEVNLGRIEADDMAEAERKIRRQLREGSRLWRQARNDMVTWRRGTYRVTVEKPEHPDTNYLTGTKIETISGRLHEYSVG